MTHVRAMPGGDRRRVTFAALFFAAALALLLALGSGTARAEETATVSNDGTATADTGGNVAVGNASTNDASNTQDASADGTDGDAVAANAGGASNESDGTAVVESGDANAAGTVSETAVNQESSGSGGIDVSDQSATVDNSGSASADTGGNAAIGNASDNTATNDQDAEASSSGLGSGDAVAVNAGGASNSSDGTAVVATGDANALGVGAATFVNQVDESDGSGFVIDLSDQSVDVTNDGDADASTGGNLAIGNLSDNDASNDQDAVAFTFGFLTGDAVAANFGGASNSSDGTAIVATGDANALGVGALSFVNQVHESEGSGFVIDLSDQSVDVTNDGDADASTGGNLAIGNLSDNDASNDQDAVAFTFGFLTGDAVAANFGGASNSSDGTAIVATGDANALGVGALTLVNQVDESDGSGFLIDLSNQSVSVANTGSASADTGGNAAIGNLSSNTATNTQGAVAFTFGLFGGDAVAVNFGGASNDSDGFAVVLTGDANAAGVWAATMINQLHLS